MHFRPIEKIKAPLEVVSLFLPKTQHHMRTFLYQERTGNFPLKARCNVMATGETSRRACGDTKSMLTMPEDVKNMSNLDQTRLVQIRDYTMSSRPLGLLVVRCLQVM